MYTLSRQGSFYAVPKGCCHCGPDHTPRWYRYSYAITVYNRGLDAQGFVVDNLRMQAWFDELTQTGVEESCERLARRAALTFLSWCRYPYHVRVSIVGFDTATAEFAMYCQSMPVRCVGLILDYLEELWERKRK